MMIVRGVCMKVSKHVYLPPSLVDEINRVVRNYGPALGVRSFSEATEKALRLWLVSIKKNEEVIKKRMKDMGYHFEE